MFHGLNKTNLLTSTACRALLSDAEPGGVSLSVDALANFDFDADDTRGLDEESDEGDKSGTGEDAPAPVQAPDEAREGESDEGENGEPATPALDPPVMWTDEEKANFASAPAELQKIIVEREAAKDAEVTRAQMRAAELVKANSAIGQIVEGINAHLETSKDLFAAKWDGVTQDDWNALAYSNPAEHKRLFGEYQAEQKALETLKAKRTESEALAKAQWVDNEANILFTELPELRNPENMNKLVKFAIAEGVTPEELDNLGAKFWKILNKTYRLSQGQTPKPVPVPDPQKLKTEQTPGKPALKPSIKPSGLARPRQGAMEQFRAAPTRDNLAKLL